ncbi:MAG TPA: pantoate--beta-alanine ligase [Steroidobacteraceae bacterium]|nr:pantoate--beta-alanine ligase [Steroidobacteraceae bacterium]
MQTVTSIAHVRERVRQWRAQGLRVAFVPTMGNLHAGHMSLIEAARAHGDRFVASIFVNPMQFGPNEDYAHYPRTPRADERMLEAAGCDLMFMPDVAEIYPNGPDNAARVEVPVLSSILDGEFRPGHFQGVATVVTKLFNIVAADAAIFGEKDYQQLTVIRRMVADLCLPVAIIGAATVRETDGLAMSSRNQYLTAAERGVAPAIYRQLQQARSQLKAGVADGEVEQAGLAALSAAGFRPDYFSVRDARDLQPAQPQCQERVVLVAARLGKARLIDNLRVSR